eukprot:CAMPEP_0119279114 /NCGR_PEP_ID=MMETSP1329-20130426/20254_1 /TAXON_ID=114041 /ORGANISM="Genus nov. species nov., Strain RCC1024" /LENGTH=95 /DNA_ID=CAMNT_0007279647 /DNA_START=58 /DNA_END=342 /DNA_ORIENTATION=-
MRPHILSLVVAAAAVAAAAAGKAVGKKDKGAAHPYSEALKKAFAVVETGDAETGLSGATSAVREPTAKAKKDPELLAKKQQRKAEKAAKAQRKAD